MPAVADDPNSPDLIIDETTISITPSPLVQGVPAIVNFEVRNEGNQNSYNLMASLFDQGEEVDNTTNSQLNVGAPPWPVVLSWTPTVPGTYNLTLKAWYGAGSAKEDVKWVDNTVEYEVTVLSRPDANIGPADLSYLADDPDYVVDGDVVTVRATIRNQGGAPISSCNVSLWEGAVGPSGELIEAHHGVGIPGSGSVREEFFWNTTGWSGKRHLFVDVEGVLPLETDLTDNRASFQIKIHTKEDLVFTTRGNEITSDFKIQFFITLEESGDLTISENGNATVFQDFSEQYDLLVTDQGRFIIDGGMLTADRNYTVFLSDNAELTLMNGAFSNVRVIANGACTVTIVDSELNAPSIEMVGGTLTISGSTVTAGFMTLSGVTVDIEDSYVSIGQTVYIDGGYVMMRDTMFSVVREFEDFGDAAQVFPQLDEHDPDTNEVPGLDPALVARGSGLVDLYNVSVESHILITSEDSIYWTHNRLGAEGRLSQVNVYRYLLVEVRDWSDQVVPMAEVKVLDYFEEFTITNGTTDDLGDVTLEVLTDYITEAQKPFVGNLRVRATAFGRTSDDLRFSHYKYPDMDFASNTMTVRIEMPPNPHPDPGPNAIYYTSPHEIVGGESGMDRNIIIDNTELTLRDTRFTMEQDFDFEWFILVTGDFGTLNVINSTMRSPFLFTIFLEEGATLNLSMGSQMPGVRIIAADQSQIQFTDSAVAGGIYAECQSIEFIRSFVDVEHTYMEASIISMTGGYLHESADLYIKANDVRIIDLELSADYEIHDQVGITTLRELVAFFGWSLLNNEEFLTNISAGYFTRFATESNITIETSHLLVDNSLIYAWDTHIMVRRSPLPDQARIIGSWVGGIGLELVSDDLEAYDSYFNRPLDDFEGADFAKLYAVEVPGIECAGSAEVERYWYLTVTVYDGAGSLVIGALLEVYSSDTNELLLPVPGTESLTKSRTNIAGRLTVPVLANITDSSGDFFVGSVYFRCKYDDGIFESNPIYTGTKQATIKSNRAFDLFFAETITPPEKEIMYCLYNISQSGPSIDLRYYNHTFENEEEATEFLHIYHGYEPERVRSDWILVRDTPINISFKATQKINDVWVPLSKGNVFIYILNGHNDVFDPSKIVQVGNEDMVVNVTTDEEGYGNTTIPIPSALANFTLYIAISGGTYDPTPTPIDNRAWNFTVLPPQTIWIDESTQLNSDPVEVGSPVSITGYVRYIFTNNGVDRAEVTISGTHISTTNGLTDEDGRFIINFQAPIMVINNLTLHIRAEDPRTGENDTFSIQYDVVPIIVPPEEPETNWALIWTVIILIVLAFAIAFGAVMMYRRHYGEVVECGECGAFIAANSTTCPKCGIEFETDLARCSECEAWIPANSSSCPVCGTAFTIESLEEQVAREEMDEEMVPIDQVTTSTATMAPLALDKATTDAKWGDRDEKRRRRIKKRVKKRLTVTDTAELDEGEVDSADLFVGEEGETTRLPGLDVDESSLDDEDLSRLLPTEDMLKDLVLTSEESPLPEDTESLEPEGELDLDEGDTEIDLGEPVDEEPSLDLEEVSLEEVPEPEEPLEEIPAPEEPEAPEQPEEPEQPEQPMEDLDEGDVPMEPEDEGPESRELLSELGLVAETAAAGDLDEEAPEDEGALSGLLTEEEEAKEAPKLCPNCGGNWILYKDGEYTCRICGENW
ncbi:MAG: hypothetical protein JSW25_06990 [Thermoplasmata archaeon]|nr:MAG: hypothetical protein JSW25_06990 [Thermoplasmata archaeon]